MKNYLPLINEGQRRELKQRLALELLIENFSAEDLTAYLQIASREQLSNLAYQLSEEKDSPLPQIALKKYGNLVEKMVNPALESQAQYYLQVAQIMVDFGRQHKLE